MNLYEKSGHSKHHSSHHAKSSSDTDDAVSPVDTIPPTGQQSGGNDYSKYYKDYYGGDKDYAAGYQKYYGKYMHYASQGNQPTTTEQQPTTDSKKHHYAHHTTTAIDMNAADISNLHEHHSKHHSSSSKDSSDSSTIIIVPVDSSRPSYSHWYDQYVPPSTVDQTSPNTFEQYYSAYSQCTNAVNTPSNFAVYYDQYMKQQMNPDYPGKVEKVLSCFVLCCLVCFLKYLLFYFVLFVVLLAFYEPYMKYAEPDTATADFSASQQRAKSAYVKRHSTITALDQAGIQEIPSSSNSFTTIFCAMVFLLSVVALLTGYVSHVRRKYLDYSPLTGIVAVNDPIRTLNINSYHQNDQHIESYQAQV